MTTEFGVIRKMQGFIRSFAAMGMAPTKEIGVALRAIAHNARSTAWNDCKGNDIARKSVESATFAQVVDFARDFNRDINPDMSMVRMLYADIFDAMQKVGIDADDDCIVALLTLSEAIFAAPAESLEDVDIEPMITNNVLLFNFVHGPNGPMRSDN